MKIQHLAFSLQPRLSKPLSFSSTGLPDKPAETPSATGKRPRKPRIRRPPFVGRQANAVSDVNPFRQFSRTELKGVASRLWAHLTLRLKMPFQPKPLLLPTTRRQYSFYTPSLHNEGFRPEHHNASTVTHEHSHGLVALALLRLSRQYPQIYAHDLAESIRRNPWGRLLPRVKAGEAPDIDFEVISPTQSRKSAFHIPLMPSANGLKMPLAQTLCLDKAAELFAQQLASNGRFQPDRHIASAARKIPATPELRSEPGILRPPAASFYKPQIAHFLEQLQKIHADNTPTPEAYGKSTPREAMSNREFRFARRMAQQLELASLGMVRGSGTRPEVHSFFYHISPNELRAREQEHLMQMRLVKHKLVRDTQSRYPKTSWRAYRIMRLLQTRPFPRRSLIDQPREWQDKHLWWVSQNRRFQPELSALLEGSIELKSIRLIRRIQRQMDKYAQHKSTQNQQQYRDAVYDLEALATRSGVLGVPRENDLMCTKRMLEVV